jgi:hypothetical protein
MQPLLPCISPSPVHKFASANLQQNTVDKDFEDGQNPYHSHSPPMTALCKHPIVKVVAREDDIEFVECQECGEVFDSVEFSDMALEEEEKGDEPSIDD